MRDVERLREKIEFSLDGRQAWTLALAAMLLMGGMFTLGMLIGRKTTPPPAAAPTDLAALDAQAAGPARAGLGAAGGARKAGAGAARASA